MVTWAPKPAAIFAACTPTTPAPNTKTLPGATPGTPPKSTPRPLAGFSKYFAPCCMAILPATSDIGVKSGKVPSSSSTVSYAIQTAFCFIIALVKASLEAKWKYVNSICPS